MGSRKQKAKNFLLTVMAGLSAAVAVFSLGMKIPQAFNGQEALSVLAVSLTSPEGTKTFLAGNAASEAPSSALPEEPSAPTDTASSKAESNPSEAASEAPLASSDEGASSQPAESQAAESTEEVPYTGGGLEEGETGYAINEVQMGPVGIKYENFSVKNTCQTQIDIGEELAKRPDIHIQQNGEPEVLIMHTHTCEAYLDTDAGVYPASFYPRTTDERYSVVAVGNAIADALNSAGIGTIHDTTIHDNPSYNGSYYRSEETIKKNLEEHPGIQVVLDIHRDALGTNETGKTKPTFLADGKKAAQIMVVAGCDDDGTWQFPDWEYNLRFALQIQKTAETMYPGMTRPMQFCPSQYNMHLTHGSLLIEVGTDANTYEEAIYSGQLLGNVLSTVLNGLKD